MQAVLQMEASLKLPAACTELPAPTVFLPSELILIKEFLESYFSQ